MSLVKRIFRYFPLLFIVFSFLGILDAGYITYEKINNVIPPCSARFQCGTVLQSEWASIGPIPLSVLGLVFYLTVFFFSLVAYFDIQEINILGVTLRTQNILFGMSILGFIFSLYLISIMAFILQAWCFYCLVSASICTTLFLLNTILKFSKST